jgi:hypothetical protein
MLAGKKVSDIQRPKEENKYRPRFPRANKKAVAKATCGIDIKANQSNGVHPYNAMNYDLQEQQQRADKGVPTCTTNQVF